MSEDGSQSWEEKFKSTVQDLEILKSDYEEFKRSSEDIEQELDAELQRLQNDLVKKEKDLTSLTSAYEDLKASTAERLDANEREISALHSRLEQKQQEIDNARLQIRKFEQEKDDLERYNRIARHKVEDYQDKIETSTETSVLLQQEIEQIRHAGLEREYKLQEHIKLLEAHIESTEQDSSNVPCCVMCFWVLFEGFSARPHRPPPTRSSSISLQTVKPKPFRPRHERNRSRSMTPNAWNTKASSLMLKHPLLGHTWERKSASPDVEDAGPALGNAGYGATDSSALDA